MFWSAVILALTAITFCRASSIEKDSLQIDKRWYKLKLNTLSKDGKWAIVYKSYIHNNDTLYLLNTYDKTKKTKIKAVQPNFISPSYFISIIENRLEIHNLNNDDVKYINGVERYIILDEELLLVWSKNKKVKLFNLNAKVLLETKEVAKYFFSKEKQQFYYTLKNSNVLYGFSTRTNQLKKLADIKGEIITFLTEHPTGDLIVELKKNDKKFLGVINNKGEVQRYLYLTNEFNNSTAIKAYFTEKNKLFLSYNVVVKDSNDYDDYLDIWHWNNQTLENKNNQFKVCSKSIVIDLQTGKTDFLNTESGVQSLFINNSQYILKLNYRKHRNYTTYHPKTEVYWMNIQTKDSVLLMTEVINPQEDITFSLDGNYLGYKREGKWFISETDSPSNFKSNKKQSEQQDLYWDQNGNFLWVTGAHDLWRYNLHNKVWEQIAFFGNESLKVEIININKDILKTGNQFKMIEDKDNILIRTFNQSDNKTIIYRLKNGELSILKNTENRISQLYYTTDANRIVFSEENFNSPPIIKNIIGKKEKLILEGHLPKKLYSWRKQKIVSFTDYHQNLLKGVLYYPKNYNKSQSYPMIIHLYERQFWRANYFDLPDLYSYMGFNTALMTDLNYFVFMPDTIITEEGAGVSALNNLIEAIKSLKRENINIDFDKMGLIGQSFGAYKVNFIVTQSNLFKAAVSGNGASDLIRNYYSYNYNYSKPHYWQIETGQYQMKKAYKDNPEIYLENSPILYSHQTNTPLLLWAGQHDLNVHWENTIAFYTALKRYRKNTIALLYKNQGHSLTNEKEQYDLTMRVIDWFNYYLKEKEKLDWMKR